MSAAQQMLPPHAAPETPLRPPSLLEGRVKNPPPLLEFLDRTLESDYMRGLLSEAIDRKYGKLA